MCIIIIITTISSSSIIIHVVTIIAVLCNGAMWCQVYVAMCWLKASPADYLLTYLFKVYTDTINMTKVTNGINAINRHQ